MKDYGKCVSVVNNEGLADVEKFMNLSGSY